MLTCKYVKGTDVLEVTEMGRKNQLLYWYFHTKFWLKSQSGKKDEAPSVPMTADQIAWVQTNYLPKATR